MTEQTIIVTKSPSYTDVYIECPHCGHSESHPADEQRSHIQTFDILEWPDPFTYSRKWVNECYIEESKMKCHVCKNEFTLIWDYSNIVYENEE